MTELQKRIAVAVPGAALFVGAILWNFWSLATLMFALLVATTIELHDLDKLSGRKTNLFASLGLNVVGFLLVLFFLLNPFSGAKIEAGSLLISMAFLVLPFLFVIGLFQVNFITRRATSLGLTLILNFIYLVVPFLAVCQLLLHYSPSVNLALLVFLFLWASDIGGYAIGRSFGKTPLFPTVSPKKSWEGFAGSLLFALGSAFLIHYISKSTSLTLLIVLAVEACIFGTLGDLIESQRKRKAGVKDSGRLLPGHGGVLDRFDGLLIYAPLASATVYIYQTIYS